MNTSRIAKFTLTFAVAAGMATAFCQSAEAAPIAIGDYNGHHYEVYTAAGISWADAQAAALALGGHLVTLTTADEDKYVNETLLAGIAGEFWAGGYQTPGQKPTEGWTWVNDEGTFSYANWNLAGGEPNDYGGVDETYLGLNLFGNGGGWNDEGYPANASGYVVEYPGRTAVPDKGSTAVLMALGLAGMIAGQWSRFRRGATVA